MERYVLGKCVIGASHLRNGIECQDSLRKIELADGSIIIAVADGHGSSSCPYSKSGSTIAVNVFCNLISELHASYSATLNTFQTYLNREGELQFAQTVDREWKKRVLKAHTNAKREVSHLSSGEKDKSAIYKQYGTTLLGLYIAADFMFAFQLGDGDMLSVTESGVELLIQTDRILGVETHSLCKEDAWKSARAVVKRLDMFPFPVLFAVSSDGFSNSFINEGEFMKNNCGYYDLIREHGAASIASHLGNWLSETSEQGCGDDITVGFAYIVN